MSENDEQKSVSGEPPAAPKMEPTPISHRPSGVQELGTAALAILLYLLLLDAAVETLLSGSPVRWIVAGAVAGYIALSVLVWRRFPWAIKAAVSLLVLLGLMAATAWQPEGLTRGVTLLRQPTSTVLSGVSGLAILFSGVLLMRWKFVPLPGRLASGLLAAYGLVAIGLGIVQGTSYLDLFHGRSQWEPLPFWLQGAFIGAVVLVPLVLAIHVIYGLMRIRGDRLRPWALQSLALALSLAMATAATTPPFGSSPVGSARLASTASPGSTLPPAPQAPTTPAAVPAPAGSPPPPPPALPVTADELTKIVKAYHDLPQRVDQSQLDIKAAAAALGNSVDAAFTFVRDQIGNEVYPGILRGPEGTLVAQAGNDLDKTLLLGTLLAAQNRTVRYAECHLTQDAARTSINAVFARPAAVQEIDVERPLTAALVQEGIPEPRAAELIRARAATHAALQKGAAETAVADLAIVRDALGRAHIAPPGDGGRSPIADGARSHYWVQTENEGRWQDLDPTLQQAQAGQVVCVVEHTYTELPQELNQYITFRVRNEYLEEEALKSATVLERKFPAAGLHGRVILFSNFPAPSDESFAGGQNAPRRLVPLLEVGDFFIGGEEFTLASETPAGPAGLFGQALGGTEGTRLVSQRLEFELTAPGSTTVVPRAIVDLVDPQDRAKGVIHDVRDSTLVASQLTVPYAIAVSTGRLDPVQVLESSYARLDPAAIGRVTSTGGAKPSPETVKDLASLEPFILTAYAQMFAVESDLALAVLSKASSPRIRVFRDQPLIVIANHSLGLSVGGKTRVGLSLDVRHNVVRVMGLDQADSQQRFWVNARDGLTDGALERYLLTYQAFRLSSAAPNPDTLEALSTSAVFDLAKSQRIDPVAAAGPDAVRLLQQRFAGTGGYLLAGEVNEAVAAVLPSQPVQVQQEARLGMWSLDLRTGHVVAFLDTGLRGLTEYERTQYNEMLSYFRWAKACITRGSITTEFCRDAFSQFWKYNQIMRDVISAWEPTVIRAIGSMP